MTCDLPFVPAALNADTINKSVSVNVPRDSFNGLLLLFYETYAGGARDSGKKNI